MVTAKWRRLSRCLQTAVVVIACTACALGFSAHAGKTARAVIELQVRIPKVLALQERGRPESVTITAQDIARGYADLAGGAIHITYNGRGGYSLQAQSQAAWVADVTLVSAAPRAQQVRMPVTYRVLIAPHAQPGSYAWPVALSIHEL
jgi:hypothetical protein